MTTRPNDHWIRHSRNRKMTSRDWDIARRLRADGVDTMQLALAFGITHKYLKETTDV